MMTECPMCGHPFHEGVCSATEDCKCDVVVFSYTKAQAVADGQQVQVPNAPIYLTTALFHRLVAPMVTRFDQRPDPNDHMVTTEVTLTVGGQGEPFPLWMVEDGDGLTLMLPEDY